MSLELFACEKKDDAQANPTSNSSGINSPAINTVNMQVHRDYAEAKKQLQEIKKVYPNKVWTLEEEQEMIMQFVIMQLYERKTNAKL